MSDHYSQYDREASVTIDGKSVDADKVYGPGTPWGLLFTLLGVVVLVWMVAGGMSD